MALFSPVVGKLTFLDTVQGPLPSWTEAVRVPDSPALGVHHVHVKAEQHAAIRVVVLARHSACTWSSTLILRPNSSM